jgi:hypothetical protein
LTVRQTLLHEIRRRSFFTLFTYFLGKAMLKVVPALAAE